MAAIYNFGHGTLQSDKPYAREQTLPTPLREQILEREEQKKPRSRTLSEILDDEKGEEGTPDSAEKDGLGAGVAVAISRNIAKRRAVATELEKVASRIVKSRGKAVMAAHLQLLREKMTKAHEALKDMPSEANYRSIITLVEADMETLDWKTASNDQLRRIMLTLAVGTKEEKVSYDDYMTQVKLFDHFAMPSVPQFDFEDEEEDDIDE